MVGLRLGFWLAASVAGVRVTIQPTDPALQYIGRMETTPTGNLRFDMPGCEIRGRVSLAAPSHISASLSQRHLPPPANPGGNSKNSGFQPNHFVVWVDGVRQGLGGHNATFVTDSSQEDAVPVSFNLTTAGAAVPPGQHDIRILKATEADWNGGDPIPNYVTFHGLTITTTTMPLERPRAVPPPPLPARKIEFLGDSITAGFCNECRSKEHDSNEEAYGATWDFQIGQLLNAQVHTAAWSGLGMVHNCCGGNTTMPSIFSRTLATVNVDNTWRWGSWVPDALVINLGTNDGGSSINPSMHYIETYTDLVLNASKNYGADLQVFLACGPMSEIYCDPVHSVLGNVAAKGVKAHFLDQRGFLNGTFGPACCGHPSVQVDTAMAQVGAATIKAALGW